VAFSGTLDGMMIDEVLDGVDFRQSGDRLEITFSSNGVDRMLLEYLGSLDPGDSIAARGFIDLSDSGGMSVGNCDIDGFFSTITRDEGDQGGTFVLRGLHAEPFCTGRELVGTLTGCFRDP
jgi:hypothetical protein